MNEVIEKKEVLLRDFNLLLQDQARENGKKDVVLIYLGETEETDREKAKP